MWCRDSKRLGSLERALWGRPRTLGQERRWGSKNGIVVYILFLVPCLCLFTNCLFTLFVYFLFGYLSISLFVIFSIFFCIHFIVYLSLYFFSLIIYLIVLGRSARAPWKAVPYLVFDFAPILFSPRLNTRLFPPPLIFVIILCPLVFGTPHPTPTYPQHQHECQHQQHTNAIIIIRRGLHDCHQLPLPNRHLSQPL